jgi:hypothetical protein
MTHKLHATGKIHTDAYAEPMRRRGKANQPAFSFSDEANYRLPRYQERRVIQSDTKKAVIPRPGGDEAKAAHIFIIKQRQSRGLRLCIAGARGVPL